jgi:streptogramin lyase
VDTATAAINIARHPAGVGNASFMSTLYGLPSGDVPFVPNLTAQPNDFTVGIQYTAASGNPGISNAESIAIDPNGYVWFTSQNLNNPGNYGLFLWNSQGVTPPLAHSLNHFPLTNNSYIFGYVSVDPAGNAWTGASTVTNSIQEFLSGTSSNPGQAAITTSQTYTGSYAIVTNYSGGSLGNVFSFSQPPGGATCTGGHTYCLNVLTPTGAVSTGSPYSMANFGSNNVSHASIGSDGYLWATSEGNGHIDRISQTGTEAPVFTLVSTGSRPEFPAIDANNNAIVPIQRNSTVDAVSVNGYVTTLTGGAYNATTNPLGTGARFFQPFGSAVDGNGNIWITNRCNGNEQYNAANNPTCTLITPTGGNTGSIVQLNGSSSLMELTPTYTLGTTITSATAVSPATNYNPENEVTTFSGSTPTTTIYPLLFDPLNVAIDPSGNIWITNFGNGSAGGTASVNGWVTELVGLAAPVVTPLSTAAGMGKLGTTP